MTESPIINSVALVPTTWRLLKSNKSFIIYWINNKVNNSISNEWNYSGIIETKDLLLDFFLKETNPSIFACKVWSLPK